VRRKKNKEAEDKKKREEKKSTRHLKDIHANEQKSKLPGR